MITYTISKVGYLPDDNQTVKQVNSEDTLDGVKGVKPERQSGKCHRYLNVRVETNRLIENRIE